MLGPGNRWSGEEGQDFKALNSVVRREIFLDAVFGCKTPLDRALLIARITVARVVFAVSVSLASMASLSFFTEVLTDERIRTLRSRFFSL